MLWIEVKVKVKVHGRDGTGSELLTRDPTQPGVVDLVTQPDPVSELS